MCELTGSTACARPSTDARSGVPAWPVVLRRSVMKLYYAPGACSLSPHIVLREAGASFELEQVNNQEKKTKSGKDYWSVNPKGQVPCLELDNGDKLTEGPVIVQYIADHSGDGLAGRPGTMERY